MDNSGNKKKRGVMAKCPDCGSGCRVSDFRDDKPLESVRFLQCNNFFCGGTFKMVLTITHRMGPCKLPRSEQVILPEAPSVMLRRNKASRNTEMNI